VQLSAAGPRVFVQDLGSTHGTRMRCGDFFRPFRFYLLAHGQDVALADLWLRLAMSEVALPGCHTIRRPSGRSADRRAAGDGGETDGSVCDGEGTTETLSTQVDGSDADSPAQRLKESGSKAAICCKVEPNAQATSDVAGQSYLPTGRTATSVGHAELGVKSENGYVDGARVQKRVRKRGVLELSDSDVEAQGKLCAQACNCKDELGDGGSAPCQIAVSASLPPLDSHECCSPRSSCHQPDCKASKVVGGLPDSRIDSDCELSPPTVASSCTVAWEPPSVEGTLPAPLDLLRGPGARSVLQEVGCSPSEELERLLELGAISLDLAGKLQDRWDALAPHVSMAHCVERLRSKLGESLNLEEPAPKRLRTCTFPSPTLDVRVAGAQDCERRLRSLQVPGMTVTSTTTASVFVASSIQLSLDFLRAVCRGLPIVDPTYLDACASRQEALPVDDFLLTDVQGELLWGFALQDARERALERGPVLSGRSVAFALDDSQLPMPMQELRDVVVAAGASVEADVGDLIVGYGPEFLSPSRLLGIVLTQRLDWACS